MEENDFSFKNYVFFIYIRYSQIRKKTKGIKEKNRKKDKINEIEIINDNYIKNEEIDKNKSKKIQNKKAD